MNLNKSEIRDKIKKAGLKVTPQRIDVYEALIAVNDHPTVDRILDYVKTLNPHIAIGTVYNILEAFAEKRLICKVKTDRDIMRYDPICDKHHHIYCEETDKIEDYFDKELDTLLETYFKNNKISGFIIRDIKLQILGHYPKDTM